MPRFIHDLPWTDPSPQVQHAVAVPNGLTVPVLPQQIVLWASLAEEGLMQLPPDAPRIPILYDSGFNGAFMIRADQLWDWCGPKFIRGLPSRTRLRARGKPMRTLAADLWLYPNVPGSSDIPTTATPFRLILPDGFGVADVGSGLASLLPLLGLFTISYNRLRTTEDGASQRFSLDTP